MWGMCAGSVGHSVIHWSFRGARSRAPAAEIYRLTEEQLLSADPKLEQANKILRRNFPPRSGFAANLLRRNWFQVETASSCYAVSTILHGMVQGGTAWATQMFIDKEDGAPCPCYVFCQHDGRWHEWSGARWKPIYEPPMPSGYYAGVGSRSLSFTGKLAIRTLLRWNKRMVA